MEFFCTFFVCASNHGFIIAVFPLQEDDARGRQVVQHPGDEGQKAGAEGLGATVPGGPGQAPTHHQGNRDHHS